MAQQGRQDLKRQHQNLSALKAKITDLSTNLKQKDTQINDLKQTIQNLETENSKRLEELNTEKIEPKRHIAFRKSSQRILE